MLIGKDHTLSGRKKFRPLLTTQLSIYIAAMSYKKIGRRFRRTLSMAYIKSLKQVQDIPPVQPRIKQADGPVEAADGPVKAADGPVKAENNRVEVESDRLFLECFVKLYTDCQDKLDTRIPNLIKMANNMPPKDVDFQLYTNETCTEFHHLLLELLDRFNNTLDALTTLDKDEAAKDSDQGNKLFNRNVGDLHRYAYGLLRLSRGLAFQMHLENIKSSLVDPRRSAAGASIEEHDEEPDRELEEELEAIPRAGSDAEKALLESYIAWLRLVVGHFDAAEILARYVTSSHFQYSSISVDILLSPPTDSALLPWSQLFTHNFLPSTRTLYPTSNDEIFSFLEKGISMASKAKDAIHHVQNALRCWCPDQPDALKTRQFLQLLVGLVDKSIGDKQKSIGDKQKSIGDKRKIIGERDKIIGERDKIIGERDKIIGDKAKAIITSIRTWEGNHREHLADNYKIANDIKELRGVLGELSHHDLFFLNLEKKAFKGTLHCEACLASLLPAFTLDIPADDSKYKEIEILPMMQVEYSLSDLFLSSDPHFRFLVKIAFWAGDWSIKTLLPCMRHLSRDLNEES